MSASKYIAIFNKIKYLKHEKFFPIFKFTHVKKVSFTYMYLMENNNVGTLFNELFDQYDITTNISFYRGLSMVWFSLNIVVNTHFVNHLHQNGFAIYVFKDDITMKQIFEITLITINKFKIEKRCLSNVFKNLKIEDCNKPNDETIDSNKLRSMTLQ